MEKEMGHKVGQKLALVESYNTSIAVAAVGKKAHHRMKQH